MKILDHEEVARAESHEQRPAARRLPFRVRLARPQDLTRVVEIRASAYERHLPRFGASLRAPEPEDARSDVLLLIAESKLDQRPLGTMRLEPNLGGPLRIESDAQLPAAIAGQRLVEICRVGVASGGAGNLVLAALAKAALQIGRHCEVDRGVVVGRRSMQEIFRSLHFDPAVGPIRIAEAKADLWVYSVDVREWERRLRESANAYYDFIFRTEHPDIQVDLQRAMGCWNRWA